MKRLFLLAGFISLLQLTGCSNPSGVSNAPPVWNTQPMVDATAGGFTVVEGSVTGPPAPTVYYYYAADGTPIPPDNDFASDGNWKDATAALPTIAPIGDYDSFGVAVNSEGTALSDRIDFTIPVPVAGDTQIIAVGLMSFNLRYCPGAPANTLPIETDDSNILLSSVPAIWIAETEITYELWITVVAWAQGNGYGFANPPGTQGDGSGDTNEHPVSMVTWRDAMVFANALTEWYNAYNGTRSDLTCVYHTNSSYNSPIRQVTNSTIIDTSAGGQDNPYVDAGADGFRLPEMYEWECAARYMDGSSWTPGDHASGATDDYTNSTECARVAVYGGSSAAIVKSKDSNALGCYDMSGNMWEYCFDKWFPYDGSTRIARSGGWDNAASTLQVGQYQNTSPYSKFNRLGLRLCRNP